MSTTYRKLHETPSETTPAKPAVGFVVTEENASAVLDVVNTAQRRGFDCIVTYGGDIPGGIELTTRLDATLVAPRRPDADVETLHETLADVARAHSYPGIVLAPVDCPDTSFLDDVSNLSADDSGRFESETVSVSADRQDDRTLAVIPAYNEAATVGDVVRAVREYADEVVVVDDGSDDETPSRAREAGATVVEHRTNRGYGAALQSGFQCAADLGVEYLVFLDADGQHDPTDLPALVEPLAAGEADMVIGSRFLADDGDLPLYRWLGLQTINALTNVSRGVFRPDSWLTDTQSGFRAFNAPTIESILESDVLGDGMAASTDVLHHAHERGFRIAEVGTEITYSVENANTKNPFVHGLSVVRNVLRKVEREHPVLTLGVPGFVSTVVGLGATYWTVASYAATRSVPLGAAFLATVGTVAGLLTCLAATILYSLSVHFET